MKITRRISTSSISPNANHISNVQIAKKDQLEFISKQLKY